ncbi:MAG: DoxX family protein [Fimbriimonadaceae bacterium]|nr:DoxX family protein [Fimbriimonadaceae bacterium]
MKKDTPTDIGLLLVRIGIGITMTYAGLGKAFGLFGGTGLEGFVAFMGSQGVPPIAAYCAVASELLGGLGVMFGFLSRIAAASIVATMAYATYFNFQKVLGGTVPMNEQVSTVMNSGIYLLLALAILIAGPGRLSMDAAIFKKNSRK